jgi:hypothetical protein
MRSYPRVEVADLGEPMHRLAVLADALHHQLRPAIRPDFDAAAGDLDAGRHPLDVPLPWTRKRLVEIVPARISRRSGAAKPPKFDM